MSLRDKAKKAEIIENENIYLSEPAKGLELCSNIICNGKLEFAKEIEEIDSIINEFSDISQSDNNTIGIKTYKELVKLKEDLINILTFPQLENCYTVAVGGGFSSGKSTFFNKILGLDNILPTDTNPTTSIASYIIKGDTDQYLALNNFHNKITLDKEAIQAISHAFNNKYNVSFSHILKLITIERKDLKYKNLVFLDTPGYSKSDDISKENNIDENIARDHLHTTDFLIWLVDCQTPISHSDMQFIKTLDLKQPILVVLNKADKKLPKDIESLVLKTKENLTTEEITFYDVIAYSSSKNIEYSKTKNVIKTYLDTISKAISCTKILDITKNIFTRYIEFYDSKQHEYRIARGVLNEILLKDGVEEQYVDEIKALSNKRIKKNKHIETSKKEILLLNNRLNEIVLNLLKNNKINIEEIKDGVVFDKEFYKDSKKTVEKVNSKNYEFPATFKLDNQNKLLKYKDLNNIEAKVIKISTLGVLIKITELNAEVFISKSKIKKMTKQSSIQNIFKLGDTVYIQILNNNSAIVKKMN